MRSEAEIRERLEGLYRYLDGARDRLKAGLDVLGSPYLPPSGCQAYDKYTDDLVDMVKALEGGIYELELVLGEEEDEEDESEEAGWHVRSIMDIPDSFIEENTRELWIERAKRDDRVYAYRSPIGDLWNLYDGHERIELRDSKSRTLDFRIEDIVRLYRQHGMTLEEFEARILDVIQASHVAPLQPLDNVVSG